MFISIGSIIIDDIILPDGRSRMGILGGGCTHAAMGMRVWSDTVGLVSAVGYDFPENLLAELAYRFDTRGIILKDSPTPRAWQLFEWDGTRNEVFRTDMTEMVRIAPGIGDLPNGYQNLAGVHLHAALEELPVWLDFLRMRGTPIILWEPWDQICVADRRNEIYRLACRVDVFSPGLPEAQEITGLEDPIQIVKEFLSHGINLIALRMGAAGSLVARSDGVFAAINALPVEQVTDVTGAGNSYCGGFIVGMVQSQDPLMAGCFAAIAASFSLGQFGALFELNGIHEKAKERLALCQIVAL
jgi:sugar/nucleoside kinase (ribokinase family)